MYVNIVKPCLDRLISFIFILLFWWLYIVLAIIVRINLGSPILFKQDRPGKINPITGREVIFTLYKFRTMTDDRDEEGRLLPDSDRLTKFGRFLRSTSLDELPEFFFNVFLGHNMSIVGPRPQLVKDMVFMSDAHRRRHSVLPGITGLAQVKGRNEIPWKDKLEWDINYVNCISFINDLKIIWMTLFAVAKRTGITDGVNATSLDYGDELLKNNEISQKEYDERCSFSEGILAHHNKPVLIHEVHDMWPATLVEMGGMSKHHPFIKILQMAENSAYRHSDAVVSILPNTEEYMLSHGLASGKYYYIPNGIVTEDWQKPDPLPEDIEVQISVLKKNGRFIVGYFGGHALSNALDTLLDVAKKIKDSNVSTKISFVMVGDGVEKARLKQRVEDEGIDNILMLDPVNKKCVPNLLELFDSIYIGLKDSSLYRFGLGLNKFYDSMMSGKPIILSTNATNTVIEAAQCGIIVPAEDVDRITDAIIALCNMSDDRRRIIGEKGRVEALKRYNYGALADDFEAVMGLTGQEKNILYIDHYAGSMDMGMEYRPYYFAKKWIDKGHKVDIIAADYSHLRKKNPKISNDLEEEVIDGINYHWIHTYEYSGNGVKRAITMFQFVGKIVIRSKKIAAKLHPDVIITSSTYPLDTYAGQKIRNR